MPKDNGNFGNVSGFRPGSGFGTGGGNPQDNTVHQTTSSVDVSAIRAPAGSTNPKRDNKIQREVRQDEARATAFGTDPDKLYRSLGKVRAVGVYDGRGKDRTQIGTKQEFYLSKSAQGKFDKAKADFEARGGAKGTAEAVSRGASGGSFQTQGDFSGGGATIGGVKPLGG